MCFLSRIVRVLDEFFNGVLQNLLMFCYVLLGFLLFHAAFFTPN